MYDGMALLQISQPPAGATFVVLADKIFDAVTSNPSGKVKKSSCLKGVKYKNILRTYPIKSLKKFMSTQTNKTEVVHFLVSQRRSQSTLQD